MLETSNEKQGVGVREEVADVTGGGGSEQCVHHSMHRHVGIGVSGQALRVVDLHSAEDQAPPDGETVSVVAAAYPKRRSRPPRKGSRRQAAGLPAW